MAALLCLPDPPASTWGPRGTKRQPSATARRAPADAGVPSAAAEAHLRALQVAAVDAGAVRALLTEVLLTTMCSTPSHDERCTSVWAAIPSLLSAGVGLVGLGEVPGLGLHLAAAQAYL